MNLPSQEKKNLLLIELEKHKSTTAIQALNTNQPSIARIKKNHGLMSYKVVIHKIVEKLFTTRFSKLKFNPMLADAFSDWLMKDYYYLNLPEIQLALLDYRGELYQVIDLDTLKIMIEEYAKRRCAAAEQKRSQQKQLEEQELKEKREADENSNPIPMPDSTKELLRKMAIKRSRAKDTPVTREKLSLIDTLREQNFKEPEAMAAQMRGEWSKEWKQLFENATIQGLANQIESESSYLETKETYFIIQSKKYVR